MGNLLRRGIFNGSNLNNGSGSGGSNTPTKVTVTFQQFKDAVVPGTFPIATSAGAVINVLKIKHSIQFAGTDLVNANITVVKDTGAEVILYINEQGIDGAEVPTTTYGLDGSKDTQQPPIILNHTSADFFTVVCTPSGADIADLTAGSVDIWYTETICI